MTGFTFISYSHKDERKMQQILSGLSERGYSFWYDDGLRSGEGWDKMIVSKIEAADSILLVITSNWYSSKNCLDEMEYAFQLGKHVVPVILKGTRLPSHLNMRLGRLQCVYQDKYPDFERFLDHIVNDHQPFYNQATTGKRTNYPFVAIAILLCVLLVMAFAMLPEMFHQKLASNDVLIEEPARTDDGYIWIRDAFQLMEMDLDGKYRLYTDLDLSGIANWVAISDDERPFTGEFDGNAHVIKNMTINVDEAKGDTALEANGFFGVVDHAYIHDVGLEKAYVSLSLNDFGSIFTDLDDYRFCNAGGIVGKMNGSILENAYFIGKISNTVGKNTYGRAAGLCSIAINNSVIRNCYSEADIQVACVNANAMVAGGSAWLNESTIENCYVMGSLVGKDNGGYVYIAGLNASGSDGFLKNSISFISSRQMEGSRIVDDDIGNFSTKESATFYKIDQIANPDVYQGWDFANVWKMGKRGPVLRRFLEEMPIEAD